MLSDWVGEERVEDLVSARVPVARAGAALGDVGLLDWDAIERVLAAGADDVMTVARGRLVDVARPRGVGDVRALMRDGVSTVIRASERFDAGLARLARSFAEAMPGEVHVQLYATPGGTNSYGWHWDFEDVFIAQTLGVKDYYMRRNTVSRGVRLGERMDFGRVKEEPSPLLMAELEAGDWLYIPRRWWHLVKCVEDSLSISVGVMPLEAFLTAVRIPAGWGRA